MQQGCAVDNLRQPCIMGAKPFRRGLTMKHLLAAAAMIAVATAMPASAQQRPLSDPVVAAPNPEPLFTSKDPKLNRNKQATLHIMRELLQCHQWNRAGEWLTDKYIQHNPVAKSGLAGVVYYFTQVAKQKPTPTCGALTSPVVAVQAEGDYVTVSTVRTLPIPGTTTGETYTTTWFDMYRFVNGKADEHWDPMALGAGPGPSASASKPAASGSGTAE
jgi:predicted SnoaL-like aldol condensation-catalyzing enzyme